MAALYSYMHSQYYGELPIVDVACQLSAHLVINPPVVKSGDGMDIQHMATVIPWLITLLPTERWLTDANV
jgi:hypothetical protein